MKGDPIRAIVFDLFGTLVDPEEFRPKHFRRAEVLADILEVNRAEFLTYWQKIAVLRSSNRRPSIEYLRDFLKGVGKQVSELTLAEADDMIGLWQDLAILNPREDILRCLKSLKEMGMKTGLLSNAEEREVRSWSASPLAPCFDFVSFSFETGKLKPELDAYRSVLNGLKMDPTSCAYVGDGGSQEFIGARKAGFREVVFMKQFVSMNGLHTEGELQEFARQADLVIDEFEALPLRVGNRPG